MIINTLSPEYSIDIINFESLHKLTHNNYDIVIVDEAHSISAYPKASKRCKDLKKIVGDKYLILMSGTPTPESFSQIFHQYAISNYTPFIEKSFYKWAKNYVNVTNT